MTDTRKTASVPVAGNAEACCGDDCCGPSSATTDQDLREEVRARYAAAADTASGGGCCVTEEESASFGAALYGADIDTVPDVHNLWYATGWCGHGWAIAPTISELLARWLLERRRPDALTPFSVARFSSAA